MSLPNWFTEALNIRPGEGRLTAALLLHSFCIGASLVFFDTAAGAMFLTAFDVAQLPWVYVGAAVVVMIAGAIYSKLEERLSTSTLLLANLLFLLGSIGAFRLSLALTDARWLVMALFGWSEVMAVLTSLEFWGLASRLLNVRQGKRLFGLIGSGEVAAGIITGLSVPVLVGPLGAQNLFFCSLAGMVASVGVLSYITRAFSDRLASEDAAEEVEVTGTKPFAELLKDRYLLLIFGLAVLSVFGYYVLDFAFYDRVEARYQNEAALASFLGLFAAVVGIVNLLSRTFLSGRLLVRFGLSVGLLALPGILAVGAISSAVVGSVVTGAPVIVGAFFWCLIITKLCDDVIRTAIDEPSVLILYQPLPAEQRLRTQTVSESIIEPIAGGLAGVSLIVLTRLFAFQALHATYVLIGILAAWMVIAVFLRRHYTLALTQALAKRILGGGALSLQDGSSIAVLRKGLASPHAGEVIYSLQMLEDIGHAALESFLIDLLGHSSSEVRLEALQRLERLGTSAALGPVQQRLDIEESPRVKGSALRTLCALGEADVSQRLVPYLDDSEPQIRRGAMVGLLRGGDIEGVLAAGERLSALVKSLDPKEREFAAHVLGEVGIRNFFRPVLDLLQDDDEDVRRAALTAAGKLKNPRLWPLVLENLAVPAVRSTAASALTAGGEEALPEMEMAFDAKHQDDHIRIRIARICGLIRGERVVRMLKERITFPRVDVRYQILSSLSACGYRAEGREVETVHSLLHKEGRVTAWSTVALVDIGHEESVSLVRQALEREQNRNLARIFLLLSFIYESQPILRARDHLAGESLEQKAYALEVIDNLVAQELKTFILPLVDDMPMDQRLKQLTEIFPEESLGRNGRLEEMISRPREWMSSWTLAAAVYAVGQVAAIEFRDAVAAALSAPSPLVRETAVWAMGRLNPEDLTEKLRALTLDPVNQVGEMARFVIESVGLGRSAPPRYLMRRSGRSEEKLFASLLLDAKESSWRRCRAARNLAWTRGPVARSALISGLEIANETVRSAVLDALRLGGFQVSDLAEKVFPRLLRSEIQDVGRTLAAIDVFLRQEGFDRLTAALEQELNCNRARILSILTLLGGDDSYDTIHYWYIRQGRRQVPEAVRTRLRAMLRSVVEEALRTRIATLFQHRGTAELIAAWRLHAERSQEALERRLMEVAFGEASWIRSWTRVCALEKIVYIQPQGCELPLQQALQDADDIVRETAAWALCSVDPEAFEHKAHALMGDPSPRVAKVARRLERE